MRQPVIAIVGAGAVGSTAAYSLMMRNVMATILLVDSNEKKCKGEAQDLADALSMSDVTTVTHASLQDAACADIIVIAAGVAQKPGQTRLDLMHQNYDIISSIMKQMGTIQSSSIIIVVTNPVDILTMLVHDLSGLPAHQVFGSGTFLDTHRLRAFLSERIHIDARSIHAYVLGEHGDTQFVPWSLASVAGVPLLEYAQLSSQQLEDIAQQAREKAYHIIACKGCTSFSVATCIAVYCHNIIGNYKRIVPLSTYIDEWGVAVSMPVALSSKGVEHIVMPSFTDVERMQLQHSIDTVKTSYKLMIDSK